jgi:dTDP-4-dehydrorhamnose 3,5-epimerase-like enzyme
MAGVELAMDDYRLPYSPKGSAQGFRSKEENSGIMYLVSEVYNPDAEASVRYDDSCG